MSKERIGVIGCGNMGGALARGILQHSTLQNTMQVHVFNRSKPRTVPLQQLGAVVEDSAIDLAKSCNTIVLAVKPYQIQELLTQLLPVLTKNTLIVSIAAGVPLATLKEYSHNMCAVVRVMPNTFIAVGQGAYGVCVDDALVTAKQKTLVTTLFSALGSVFELTEDKFNAFSALAGCGPAYIYYMAEALVDAGVRLGLDRKSSTEITLSLFAGSAALAEQTGTHISALREQVTSPGGTTIAATHLLDSCAVKGSIMSAVKAAYDRNLEMDKG